MLKVFAHAVQSRGSSAGVWGWQRWGSSEDGGPGGKGGPGRWGSRTPALTSTSLHCFPTRVFPYDLIFPWLSLVILWQGNYFAVKGKQIWAILFPPVFTGVLERWFCFLLQAEHKDRTGDGERACVGAATLSLFL